MIERQKARNVLTLKAKVDVGVILDDQKRVLPSDLEGSMRST